MNKLWVKMPSEWIRNKKLVGLKWTDAGSPRSHKIAALQIFIAIALTSEDRFRTSDGTEELLEEKELKVYASSVTYDLLMRMTGLSRGSGCRRNRSSQEGRYHSGIPSGEKQPVCHRRL
ncbi:hypothetical protein WDV93_21620 [Pantoea ananatis]